MAKKPYINPTDIEANLAEKHKRFIWVRNYIVDCFNDGTAYEDPEGFKLDINKFIEPVIADQIKAIHYAADMERELLRRDGRIIQLETQAAFEKSLKKIFNALDQAIEDYINNPEERELLREIETLASMDINEDNAAEYSRRMKDALRRAKDVMDPAERQQKLKKTMNEAVFGVPTTYRDEMIVPLRRFGMDREEREGKFVEWISKHYGL